MKVVTVNVHESYLDAIKKLVGEKKLYPSRSELVRVACREFLIREMGIIANLCEQNENQEKKDDDVVRVPIVKVIREFKEYKIIRRLEDVNPRNNNNADISERMAEEERQLSKNPRKKRKPLGNIFFGTAWDKNGNLITERKNAEILNQ